MFFHHIYEIFLGEKSEIFQIWENQNIRRKKSTLRKRFRSLKRHLHQNGKAESMLMVAGRLIATTPQ